MKNNYFSGGIFFFIILSVSSIFEGTSQQIFNIDSVITVGNDLIKEKQYENAYIWYASAFEKAEFKNDTSTKLILHQEIGKLYRREKKYKKAIVEFKRGIKLDSTSLIAAYCYQSIALIKRRLKEKDSVLPFLNAALSIYREKGDDEVAYNTFFNAGVIYKNRRLFEKALSYLLLANEGFNKTTNVKKLGAINNAIAEIQNILGNNEKAFYYYSRALSYREQAKDTVGIAMSFNNIANAYKTKKEYDSALFYYNRSLKLVDKNSRRYPSTLYNMGVAYYLKDDLTNAKSFYRKALKINKEQSNTESVFYNANELALLSVEDNNIKAAAKYLNITDSLIDKIENQEVIYRNYEIKALFNNKKGDYRQAYHFQKKYSDLYQSIFNTRQVEIVQQLQERFETEKKQNENLQLSLLNQENQILINKQKSSIKINRLFLLISLLLLLLMIIAYLLLNQRQKALKHKQAVEQLKAIYEGQEVIKKVISKDLHDIIATNLDGIRLKVQALSLSLNEGKKKFAEDITNNIQDINHQMRLISHRLSPLDDKIKKYKLSQIIISQLSEFQTYRKILVNIKDEIPEVLDKLKLEAQTNFYAILLEALNNIEKYSKATEVMISHNIDQSDTLYFKIKDNGIGFKETDSNGIGILNMQQRAKLLKGICSVFSTSKGTELSLEFPLNIHLR